MLRVARPEEDRRLIQAVEAALAAGRERAGEYWACYPGCARCCYGPFPVNLLDAWRLRRGIRRMRRDEPEKAAAILERARKTSALFAPHFPGYAATGIFAPGEKAEGPFADRFAAIPCPALGPDSGACEIYPYRPVSCRAFGPPVRFGDEPMEQCKLCFVGATTAEIEAGRVHIDPENLEPALIAECGREQTLITFALTVAEGPIAAVDWESSE